jgi:hypothetical protein
LKCIGFLARKSYRDWLEHQACSKGNGYEHKKGEKYSTGDLNAACLKLCRAALSDRPSKVFGDATYTLSELIDRSYPETSAYKEIEAALNHVVLKAAAIINKTFETCRKCDEDGRLFVWQRCNYDM